MRSRILVGRLPSQFRGSVRSACVRILRRYPNTIAFVVIGSVALGSWEQDSDVDLVWVLRGRRRRRWQEEIRYDSSGVLELVPLNVAGLRKHFAQRSPMSHAIRRGTVLYDPEGVIKRFTRLPVASPARAWMKEWFEFFCHRFEWGLDSYRRARRSHRRYCADRCTCQVTDTLYRAVVNLALILLTTRRIVPNSKAEMRAHYPALIRRPPLRAAMEVALRAHHEKRDLALDEAAQLVVLGRWLRARLVSILGKPKSAARLAGTPRTRRRIRNAF